MPRARFLTADVVATAEREALRLTATEQRLVPAGFRSLFGSGQPPYLSPPAQSDEIAVLKERLAVQGSGNADAEGTPCPQHPAAVPPLTLASAAAAELAKARRKIQELELQVSGSKVQLQEAVTQRDTERVASEAIKRQLEKKLSVE